MCTTLTRHAFNIFAKYKYINMMFQDTRTTFGNCTVQHDRNIQWVKIAEVSLFRCQYYCSNEK